MNGSAEAEVYRVRRARFDLDRQAIVDVWRGNLGDPARADYKFEWFYEQSPTGAPLTFVLEWSGAEHDKAPDLVGVAAAGRRQLLLANRQLDAGLLVDMAVVPQHRSLYPALLLQKTLLQSGMESFPVLYGFPNRKAAAVFRRAGYLLIGPMSRFVRVVRSRSYVAQKLPGWAAVPVGFAVDWLAMLRERLSLVGRKRLKLVWSDVVRSDGEEWSGALPEGAVLHGLRNAEFLAWRFQSDSGRQYGRISVHYGDETAELGYWITEAVDDVLHLRDCPLSLLDERIARAAWLGLFREARSRGFKSVSFECLAPADLQATLMGCGMRPRSERPVYGKVREGALGDPAVLEWYLTAADEDE